MSENILFITADQLRYDALGFQNVFPVRTPTIDRLADEGTVFDQAYCANPLCVPARASIMTGQPCCEHGVYYNDGSWDPNLPTIPGVFSDNGYATVAVGKMHFRPDGVHRGFDKRAARNYARYLQRHELEEHQPPAGDGSPHAPNLIKWEYDLDHAAVPKEHYRTRYIADCAIHELDLLHKRRECGPEGDEPFFMWLSFIQPHTPCDPPPPYDRMYDPDDLPAPVRSEEEAERFPQAVAHFRSHWDQLDDETIRRLRARYLGNVTMIDDEIARVLGHLENLGIRDNTLIVFSADHGDHLGDHGLQQKSFFYDAAARIPLIFQGPGIPAGRRIDANVSHLDLTPTLLHYAKLARTQQFDPDGQPIYPDADFGDAVDLTPAFADNEADGLNPQRPVFCESGVHGLHIMVKLGDQKYNYYPDTQEIEHYDLTADPNELNNLGGDLVFENLPPAVKKFFERVLTRAERYRNRYYLAARKLHRMFT